MMSAKLDGELQAYMQQHVNPAQEVTENSTNAPQM